MTKTIQRQKYSVVIVEYFSGHHLIDCIDSLNNQIYKAEKIVIVLNGIDEHEKQRIEDNYKEIHLIDPHCNLGYSAAANLGIASTDTPIVVTLNPDTILDQDATDIACKYLDDNIDVGSVGPQIREVSGEIYPSARNEPNIIDAIGHALLGTFFPNNRYTKRYKDVDSYSDEIRQVDWLSGACIFLRRDALDDIGGWDERFFMYCEDIDLGRSLRGARWKNVYVPQSQIVHIQGVSTDKTPIKLLIHHHKSLYIYTKKKFPNNIIMQFLMGIFIAIRLPLSLIARLFRIS